MGMAADMNLVEIESAVTGEGLLRHQRPLGEHLQGLRRLERRTRGVNLCDGTVHTVVDLVMAHHAADAPRSRFYGHDAALLALEELLGELLQGRVEAELPRVSLGREVTGHRIGRLSQRATGHGHHDDDGDDATQRKGQKSLEHVHDIVNLFHYLRCYVYFNSAKIMEKSLIPPSFPLFLAQHVEVHDGKGIVTRL